MVVGSRAFAAKLLGEPSRSNDGSCAVAVPGTSPAFPAEASAAGVRSIRRSGIAWPCGSATAESRPRIGERSEGSLARPGLLLECQSEAQQRRCLPAFQVFCQAPVVGPHCRWSRRRLCHVLQHATTAAMWNGTDARRARVLVLFSAEDSASVVTTTSTRTSGA